MWVSAPPDELSLEMGLMIDEQVNAVRAQRLKQAAHRAVVASEAPGGGGCWVPMW